MLAWLERHQLLILAAAALVLAAALLYSELKPGSSPTALELRYAPDLPVGSPIRVHVAGAVLQPGVVDLHEGDRVSEALAAAGGPAGNADLDAVNLAERVHDEQQVAVPTSKAGARSATPLPPGTIVNINTASADQLDALPGIGEAYSRRIVDSRSVDGPFTRLDDLVDRKVIPRATFDKIQDLITVGP